MRKFWMSSGSRVLVSMNMALTLTCITRMKFSPESCSSGVRVPSGNTQIEVSLCCKVLVVVSIDC